FVECSLSSNHFVWISQFNSPMNEVWRDFCTPKVFAVWITLCALLCGVFGLIMILSYIGQQSE
ncbi:hypothetical protein PRIPAC_94377, partial [Pristionchus pacificus]